MEHQKGEERRFEYDDQQVIGVSCQGVSLFGILVHGAWHDGRIAVGTFCDGNLRTITFPLRDTIIEIINDHYGWLGLVLARFTRTPTLTVSWEPEVDDRHELHPNELDFATEEIPTILTQAWTEAIFASSRNWRSSRSCAASAWRRRKKITSVSSWGRC